MKLIAIKETLGENAELAVSSDCSDMIGMSVEFYLKAGFIPPWICYLVEHEGEYVGGAGIKGSPVNGTVELAYGIFENHQGKGYGTRVCGLLVDLCLSADPALRITARTLPDNEPSKKILMKNKFIFTGPVTDPDDGLVWEWLYSPDVSGNSHEQGGAVPRDK